MPKRLWLYKKRPDLRAPLDESQEQLFQRGTDVGMLARQLFPGGKDTTPKAPFHYAEAVQQTRAWIEAGETVIYEAAFQHNRVLDAIDILIKLQGIWYAYELKSSIDYEH